MIRKYIPVAEPDLGKSEKIHLNKAFDSGWISSTGEYVDKFQTEWAQLFESKYCLAVSSGTTALHLALLALNIGPGDEVIVPTLTFIATANAVSYTGAKPVFSDVNSETWCIDTSHIAKLLSKYTKAIICVDLYGNPCNLIELKKFCEENSLHLISDAAESPFAEINGKKCASIADITTFSFYGNKIISSGEGGAIITNNKDFFLKMKLLRDQGMDPNVRYYFQEIGYNYRITNLQAALLVAQTNRHSEILKKRTHVFTMYDHFLDNHHFVTKQKIKKGNYASPWLYTIRLQETKNINISVISRVLQDNGIETRPIFIPLHTLPPYRNFTHKSDFVNSTLIARTGISLPTSTLISDEEIKYVCDKLIQIYEN